MQIDPAAEGSNCVFVGNLSFDATEDDVRELFSIIGALQDVRVAHDMEGNSRGFGHVEYISPDDAKEALSLNG